MKVIHSTGSTASHRLLTHKENKWIEKNIKGEQRVVKIMTYCTILIYLLAVVFFVPIAYYKNEPSGYYALALVTVILVPLIYLMIKIAWKKRSWSQTVMEWKGEFHVQDIKVPNANVDSSGTISALTKYCIGPHLVSVPNHWLDSGKLKEGQHYRCEGAAMQNPSIQAASSQIYFVLSLDNKHSIEKDWDGKSPKSLNRNK